MPALKTYPGVYIEEVPSGVRTIAGVSTSVAAFIGTFSKGPINHGDPSSPNNSNYALQIFNPGDFEREFGGLRADSEASYAVTQFFLNGGTEAWVVRVASADDLLPPEEGDPLPPEEGDPPVIIPPLEEGDPPPALVTPASVIMQDTAGESALLAFAGRRIKDLSVHDAGDWGNKLRIEIDYNTPNFETEFNLIVSEYKDETSGDVLQQEVYRNLTMVDTDRNYVVEVVNEASRLIQLVHMDENLNRPAATGSLGGDASAALVGGGSTIIDGATFTVDINGATATATLSVDSAPATLSALRTIVQSAIRSAVTDDATLPLLTGANIQLSGNGLRILANTKAPNFSEVSFSFTGPAATAMALNDANPANNVQLYVLGSENALGPGQFRGATTRGSDGQDPTDPENSTDLAAALIGGQEDKTGLFALEDVDIFNILSIPQAAELEENDMSSVYTQAEIYCEQRRAFLIVDIPPNEDTLQEATDWLNDNAGLRHKNAAVYFPRPRIPDPLNDNRLRSVGASGTMAGLYARTDSTRGVWKAPAGIEGQLRNVPQLSYKLTDPENGQLNPLGMNALRNFDVFGNVSWGARTLMGANQLASEWQYIPVRRLALFLEESLFRGTQWVVFEPNDEPLWAQIRLNIGAFMQNLFRQGAFQGTTPRDAYLVKCDSETTTQNDINNGIVNIVVGFAPLKPAEFVIIKIQQLAGDIQT